MPKVDDVPKFLRPFLAHGVQLEWSEHSEQATGDCPFCGREGKFGVKVEDGRWRCFVCAAGTERGGGNVFTFLRELYAIAPQPLDELTTLAVERKIVSVDSLVSWGIKSAPLTDDWLVPGYNAEGKLTQLYRYAKQSNGHKRILYATPGLHQQIHGVNLYDPKKPDVWVFEGPWDAIAAWEVMGHAKVDGEGLSLTSNEQASLRGRINVLAVPGCGSIGEPFSKWTPLFKGKRLAMFFDSDHPRKHPQTQQDIPPAGHSALQRAIGLLSKCEEPPKEVGYLHWGEHGYDPTRKDGYDVRDWISPGKDIKERIALIQQLINHVLPIPDEWIKGKLRSGSSSNGEITTDCVPCYSWKELINQWRKAIRMTVGIDIGLSVCLACVTSTRAVGDQLWIKLLGPASCGKSTIAEALSVNKQFILAKSHIRGFHSGFQTDREGTEDHSLMKQVQDKTLVTKDGDTLLKSPNVGQILAEARDIYDGVSRVNYRNAIDRCYENFRMTWILCGTGSLRELDTSELGERFLDCVIMEGIDDELEDEINWRVVNRADRSMSLEADGTAEGQDEPDQVLAKQMTGGYIHYLRTNARDLLAGVEAPEASLRKIINLGKFIAHFRARPSAKQSEKAEREFSARLCSQLTRLAKCLAVVLNRVTIDDEVMHRVTKVALDTARGRTLSIAKAVEVKGTDGTSPKAVSLRTNQSEDEEKKLMRFMRKIGILETVQKDVNSHVRWRLTAKMRKLYHEVLSYVKTEDVN